MKKTQLSLLIAALLTGANLYATEPAKPAEAAKPADAKPAEAAKPADAKPAEAAKPADAKPADAKPADAKPAEAAKPADAKPTEAAKPADAKPAEAAKPADAKPAEAAKPADAKPAEAAKPADAKPAEAAKPADAKPAEKKADEKAGVNLSGSWSSTHGGDLMTIEHKGDKFTANYEYAEDSVMYVGKIEATVKDKTIEGTWSDKPKTGRGESYTGDVKFTIVDDKTLLGKWRSEGSRDWDDWNLQKK